MRESRLALFALLAALVANAAAASEPTRERQHELIYRLKQDCGSCHGMTLKGGLGPPLLPSDVAGASDEALVDVILGGFPGTPMPPWSFEISRSEARWLVRRLKEGVGDDH
jgi:cytochrome c55X